MGSLDLSSCWCMSGASTFCASQTAVWQKEQKHLSHTWYKCSAMAALMHRAASQIQGLCLWVAAWSAGAVWAKESRAAGLCQGNDLCILGGEHAVDCARCSWAGCVFHTLYPQPKVLLQIYAQLILLCRKEFFSTQLCYFIFLKWPICVQWSSWLRFILGAILAAPALRVMANAGSKQFGNPDNLMQNQK